MASFDAVIAWVGCSPELMAALRMSAGDFTLVREVCLVPMGAWDTAVTALRIVTTAAVAAQPDADPPVVAVPQVDRPPSALELGQVASLRRVCRLRLGLPAEETQVTAIVPALLQPQGLLQQALPLAPGPPVLPPRKIKMSSVIDQADDGEIYVWDAERVRTTLTAFRAGNQGEDAPPEDEPSGEQFSALDWKIQQGGPPACDFGVWRPHGQRLQRALKLTVHHHTPGGDYVPYEVPGPPSYSEWLKAWRVFVIAMMCLGAATQTRLAMYARKIAELSEVYGEVCWWLVAQADWRMRSEHMPLLLRWQENERAAHRPHGLDPACPWDHIFKVASQDEEFWDRELERKAVLYITHLKSKSQLEDDGTGVDSGGQLGGGDGSPIRKRQKIGGRGKSGRGGGGNGGSRGLGSAVKGKGAGKTHAGKGKTGKGESKRPDGRWRSDASGKPICWGWAHKNGCSTVCPDNRAHCCEFCRSTAHRTTDCPQKPAGWSPPN